MKVKDEEARRKLNKIVKLDRSQNNQLFKQTLNDFLNASKQKLDAILLLQLRIQTSMDKRSLFQFCEDNKRVLEDALERYSDN
ncbi:Oidioi.mRNA.OKI2018_I69.PAR.g9540.t1.cds [Oikopleura dioica]|uniref:Oidioi.mRNA.OKI2018_I69.PAR.g9540.t1.cds n=1 Tax=Oikopleura dioica TaxID=34765 RepID=A0ABN7RQM6_OIKDI|nr:Oidioi.mRNA.OKI2018_I69.PAR.g9540.t1.cds [Oikopleura dioica]